MRCVGVIPARGGSKGVPRKNLRMLGDESLVARCIRGALAARTLDKVLVSTDDDEIARVGAASGAEVVRRPPELATDDSPTDATLAHALATLDVVPRWVVTLEPTAPFRRPDTIDRCVRTADEHDAGSVVTVRADTSSFGRLGAVGQFIPLEPGAPRRRQLRDPLYAESGTVWVTRAADVLAGAGVLVDPVYAVEVGPDEATDINTELDLTIARAVLGAGGNHDPVPHR
ncbi:acylneuraminate cytidylyltransferase family protein [Actinomycetospora aeridis]|uniref:Acylneuraminate cytidylyltransferase family protein n=1 Tax=Actinomycetospora aeridis TaxID=3129231 RepID=A0ABU8N7H4_9PSEU